MLRIRLSRALLAALAVAALTSGVPVTSSVANASPKIDPGFSRGPPRIDPGIGNGSTRVDPGFNRNSGPQYTVEKLGVIGRYAGLYRGCHWIDRPVSPGTPQPKHPGPNGNKVKVCY